MVYTSSMSRSLGAAPGSACSRWSLTHRVSKPPSSAAAAISVRLAAIASGPAGQLKFVTDRLTRMSLPSVVSVPLHSHRDAGPAPATNPRPRPPRKLASFATGDRPLQIVASPAPGDGTEWLSPP